MGDITRHETCVTYEEIPSACLEQASITRQLFIDYFEQNGSRWRSSLAINDWKPIDNPNAFLTIFYPEAIRVTL